MSGFKVDNSIDILDSRDVMERIDELEGLLIDKLTDVEESKVEVEEIRRELDSLKKLQDGASTLSCGWDDGETLIRDSYFEDYAREFASDIGAVSKDFSWPNNHIDWISAAEELKMDFVCVDFDGVDYWIRG